MALLRLTIRAAASDHPRCCVYFRLLAASSILSPAFSTSFPNPDMVLQPATANEAASSSMVNSFIVFLLDLYGCPGGEDRAAGAGRKQGPYLRTSLAGCRRPTL
jgi:hypothetical protein